MTFLYTFKNFEVDPRQLETLGLTLRSLQRTLNTFAHYEKKGEVYLEKLPNGRYLAKISFHVPGHTIIAKDIGFTPLNALHTAAFRARLQLLKAKEAFVDYHRLGRVLGGYKDDRWIFW